jgi:regulator of RNase E activity RraA
MASANDILELQRYSACDISDALLKLKVPGAGFIADLGLVSPAQASTALVTVAPVSTVLFAPKGQELAEPAANIPKGVHWADLTVPGTIVVLKHPDGQKNAVCGGIMAVRMKVCQAKGIIVAGRARDIEELRTTSLPVSLPIANPLSILKSLKHVDLVSRTVNSRCWRWQHALGYAGAS